MGSYIQKCACGQYHCPVCQWQMGYIKPEFCPVCERGIDELEEKARQLAESDTDIDTTDLVDGNLQS